MRCSSYRIEALVLCCSISVFFLYAITCVPALTLEYSTYAHLSSHKSSFLDHLHRRLLLSRHYRFGATDSRGYGITSACVCVCCQSACACVWTRMLVHICQPTHVSVKSGWPKPFATCMPLLFFVMVMMMHTQLSLVRSVIWSLKSRGPILTWFTAVQRQEAVYCNLNTVLFFTVWVRCAWWYVVLLLLAAGAPQIPKSKTSSSP